MIRKHFIFFLAIFLCGCAIRHAEEIRLLQQLAREAEEQSKDVSRINERFRALLDVVVKGQMHEYNHQYEFLDNFGPPVFNKRLVVQGKPQELWLYRYYEKMWGSDKVYLYFDQTGLLLKWEHRQAQKP